jgi:hypothetical protein
MGHVHKFIGHFKPRPLFYEPFLLHHFILHMPIRARQHKCIVIHINTLSPWATICTKRRVVPTASHFKNTYSTWRTLTVVSPSSFCLASIHIQTQSIVTYRVKHITCDEMIWYSICVINPVP